MPGIEEMLSRKIGPLPVWSYVVLAGGVGMIIFRAMKAKQAASGTDSSSPGQGTDFSSTQTVTGTDASGQQYTSSYTSQGNGYLPGQLTWGAGQMPVSGGDVYVNYPTQTNTDNSNVPPDQVSPGGQDVGQYRFGNDQLAYLVANKGKFGITDAIISDVQKAYAQISQQKGQGQANMMHYSWIGPGNVQAIPPYVNSTQDILTNLP